MVVGDELAWGDNPFGYTIRTNKTVTPNTDRAKNGNRFIQGRGRGYQEYLLSGFPSMQQMLDNYFLRGITATNGEAIGAVCSSGPQGTLDPYDLAVQLLNSTSLDALKINATRLVSLLGLNSSGDFTAQNLSDLVPGLVLADGMVNSTVPTPLLKTP